MLSSMRLLTRAAVRVAKPFQRSRATSVTSLDNIHSVRVELVRDRPGALSGCLETFKRLGLNMKHIETSHLLYTDMTINKKAGPTFLIDYETPEGPGTEYKLFEALREHCRDVVAIASCEVPWFPRTPAEVDAMRNTLGEEELINEEHPGFTDEIYKKRRTEIAAAAATHAAGSELPFIEYMEDENETWSQVYDKLTPLLPLYACNEHREAFKAFEDRGVFRRDKIPQIRDVDAALKDLSGFRMRPIVGLLTARDFLASLAFRLFACTQYIRHSGNPFYTPEPDICHELLGHVPMLANKDFAQFTQTIGIASLGAPDEVIVQLATLYWFTVEFGLLRQDGRIKAYGAGVLSSFGELEWACADEPSTECREAGSIIKYKPKLMKPELLKLDAKAAAVTPFPISMYQPQYWYADTIQEVKEKVLSFCDGIPRSFTPTYNAELQHIEVNRNVRMIQPDASLPGVQAGAQKSYFEGLLNNIQ